jgi:hypothetical protein
VYNGSILKSFLVTPNPLLDSERIVPATIEDLHLFGPEPVSAQEGIAEADVFNIT